MFSSVSCPATGTVVCSLVAESVGEVLAQLPVLLGQLPDALLRGLQPP
jgi:hypothetical protein